MVTPDQVGLALTGHLRRVTGLRREEVAQLAPISTEYYTRLEQVRLPGASPSTLEAIARALPLDADQTRYLYELADKHAAQPSPAPANAQPNGSVLRPSCSWTTSPTPPP
ncbi:helix-turn-helix domain-containing protein [Streptomyces sp. NBC_00344]|uniref:helix-turn-helix domain-containing protein n=1 Tax=Streptomyces sp. NBC_00344 TaxID=2975720 RepID=UPI002E23ACDD